MIVTTYLNGKKFKVYYTDGCDNLTKFLRTWEGKPEDDLFLNFAKFNNLSFTENVKIYTSRLINKVKKEKKNAFLIEKNIPITKHIRKSKYPFKDMDIGDSFIISEEYSDHELRLKSNAARRWLKSSGTNYKFTLRKTEDNKIRIWRIK